MFGVNMGYQPVPEREVFEKWAWLPKKTTSGKWVWNKKYYQISTYCDENGKAPIKGLAWVQILNEKEYLIWQIKNPKKELRLPTFRKSAVY